jgi:hypothetical protein
MRPVGAYWGHFAAKRPEISTNGSTRSESSRQPAFRALHSAAIRERRHGGLARRLIAVRRTCSHPGYLALRTLTHATSTRARAYDVRHIMFGTLLHEYLNVANNLFASSCDGLRPRQYEHQHHSLSQSLRDCPTRFAEKRSDKGFLPLPRQRPLRRFHETLVFEASFRSLPP